MILDQLAAAAVRRVEEAKRRCPLSDLRSQAENMGRAEKSPFFQALAEPGMSFICEVKKASPSKGLIAEDFPYLDIARDYQAAGAAAISVLTEPEYFLGSDSYLREIAKTVKIPVLRKDFTVDAYQIYEAKTLGASGILLICALLEVRQLEDYLELAHSLGLSALVEAHDETEIEKALGAGAGIIGVNNRNLKNFQVDVENSLRLRSLVPADKIYVAESGIRTPEDVKKLYDRGVHGVLIGESLMCSPDKGRMLAHLAQGCKDKDPSQVCEKMGAGQPGETVKEAVSQGSEREGHE